MIFDKVMIFDKELIKIKAQEAKEKDEDSIFGYQTIFYVLTTDKEGVKKVVECEVLCGNIFSIDSVPFCLDRVKVDLFFKLENGLYGLFMYLDCKALRVIDLNNNEKSFIAFCKFEQYEEIMDFLNNENKKPSLKLVVDNS